MLKSNLLIMSPIFYVVLLFFTLEFFSFIYSRLFFKLTFLRSFIFLGVFFHELAHYLACKIMLAPVKKFHIGWRDGHVIHGQSKIPFLGAFIISLAPLFLGLAGLVGLLYYLNNGKELINSITQTVLTADWLQAWYYFKLWLAQLNYASWQFWLSLFLTLNILAVFVPSRQDYKNIFFVCLIYIILSYFFTIFNQFNLVLINILILANLLLVLASVLLLILNILKRIMIIL